MASKYYSCAILAATLAAASHAAEEFAPLEEAQRADRELGSWKKVGWGNGGWGNDGWSSSSSSSKSGKSGGSGSGKSGKSGGSGSSSSSSDDHHGWSHGGGWGNKPDKWGGWGHSSSSSGKSGKSGGGKSGKSGGSSSSSSSHDHGGWSPNWGGIAWGDSSSSSSGKSGKSGGGKSGKSGGSSSSSSHDGPGWGHWGKWGNKPGKWGHGGWSSSSSSSGKSGKSGGGKSGKSGGSSSSISSHDGWGGWPHNGWGKPGKWGHSGWPSSSSSSSGKSGKSGGGKSGKSGGSSSSSSHDEWSHGGDWGNVGGHWAWVGPAGGWSSSSSSSGKSGKSGGSGSGSGKSGKSGGSSPGSESIDSGKWSDDGWENDDIDNDDAWAAPLEIYSKGGSLGGWKADGWDNDGHYKADIDYVRAHITKLIEDSERELIPKFLRLGFHDCVGGCDGCVDLDNADNKGLKEPIEAIHSLVEKFSESHSRADIWALATLVSADMAVLKDRPVGLNFPMRYIGRKDCSGASPSGVGGPDVEMPSNDLTTHELLDFFKKYFDFDEDETVTIMGVHAVAVAHRENVGFGNKGKEDGWVFDAESYSLDNRYYGMLAGDNDWHMELVHNDNGIPSRYQWYHEKDGEEERPIMTNSDMSLVRDFSDYIHDDKDGNGGAVSCSYKDDKSYGSEGAKEAPYTRGRRTLQYEEGYKAKVACPVASHTMEKMIEYKMDNELWLYEFQHVLEKMVKNGY